MKKFSFNRLKILVAVSGLFGLLSASSALAAPVNDLFLNSLFLSGSTINTTGSSIGATLEAGETNIIDTGTGYTLFGSSSVWWSWTPSSSGTVTISTSGSSFDTFLGVYTGSSVSALSEVAGNDDENAAASIYTSKVTFSAVGGTTYRIKVDGYGSATGSISLSISLAVTKYTLSVSNSPSAGGSIVNYYTSGTLSGDLINCGSTCSYTASPGTTVYLRATFKPGYTFTSWSGCPSASGNTCTVTLNSNVNVTANYTPNTYTLSVSNSPSAGGSVVNYYTGSTVTGDLINCGAGPCSYTASPGTTVYLQAAAKPGYNFSSWSGCPSPSGKYCTATMNSNLNVIANYTPTAYTLSVSNSPSSGGLIINYYTNGSTVTSDLINCGSTCSYKASPGTTIYIKANSLASYIFSSWSGCPSASANTCTITLNSDVTVTANYTGVTYQLSVSKNIDGGFVSNYYTTGSTMIGDIISCGSTCSATLSPGTTINLQAPAKNGYTFTGWSGSCSGTGNCTVTVNSNTSVMANYAMNSYTLTLNKNIAAAGFVQNYYISGSTITGDIIYCGTSCSSTQASQPYNTTIYLQAIALAGFQFSGWSGACTGTGNCTVTYTGNKTLTANYADVSGPTTPSNLAASTVSSSQINLSWTSSTDNTGVTSYEIYQCTGAGCTPSGSPVKTLSGTPPGSSTYIASLAANTTYGFYIIAYDAAGNSSSVSNVAYATTAASSYTITVTKSINAGGTVLNYYLSGTLVGDLINCGSTCSQSLSYNSTINLKQNTNSGYSFSGWTGDCTGTGTCTLTMNANHSVTANYQDIHVTINSFASNPATVGFNYPANLSWNVSGAFSTGCSVKKAGTTWLTNQSPTASNISTGPLAADTTFTLSCTGAGGTVSQDVLVTVASLGAATAWGWSANIGWIDLSGIIQNADGTLSGYAWSSNIGWIQFGGLSGFPDPSIALGTLPVNAMVDSSSHKVWGWARACSGSIDSLDNYLNFLDYPFHSPDYTKPGTCSNMTNRPDGFDGWISLQGSTTPPSSSYGLIVDSSGRLNGYAWGSNVIGYISVQSGNANQVCTMTQSDPSGATRPWTYISDQVTATDPESDYVQYQVAWGDNATSFYPAAGNYTAPGVTQTLKHMYSKLGTFTIQAQCKDSGSQNLSNPITKTWTIQSPPGALITGITSSGASKDSTVTWSQPAAPFSYHVSKYKLVITETNTGTVAYTRDNLPGTATTFIVSGSYLKFATPYTATLTTYYLYSDSSILPAPDSQMTFGPISPIPISINCYTEPLQRALVNNPVNLVAVINGGVVPYTIHWTDSDGLNYTVTGVGTGQQGSNVQTFVSRVYSTASLKIISASVTDSNTPTPLSAQCPIGGPSGASLDVRAQPYYREF